MVLGFGKAAPPGEVEFRRAQRMAGRMAMREFVDALACSASDPKYPKWWCVDTDAVERVTGWPVGQQAERIRMEPDTPLDAERQAELVRQPAVVGWYWVGDWSKHSTTFLHPFPAHPGWVDGTFVVPGAPPPEGADLVECQRHERRFPKISHMKSAKLRALDGDRAPLSVRYHTLTWDVNATEYRLAKGLAE